MVASVIDLICESNGLNEMIKRVNNDLLRDDGIFMDDMKLTYFEILSKSLAFNRLKLDKNKKEFELQRARDIHEGRSNEESAPKWEPDLRNMYSALDKMTENHVLKTMEEGVKRKQFHDVVKAMEFTRKLCATSAFSSNPVTSSIGTMPLPTFIVYSTQQQSAQIHCPVC